MQTHPVTAKWTIDFDSTEGKHHTPTKGEPFTLKDGIGAEDSRYFQASDGTMIPNGTVMTCETDYETPKNVEEFIEKMNSDAAFASEMVEGASKHLKTVALNTARDLDKVAKGWKTSGGGLRGLKVKLADAMIAGEDTSELISQINALNV